MAEMTEVAAHKYGRLIEAMDTLYANSTGAQKEWIDNNWKSILDGMVERGEEMIQGWKGEPEVKVEGEPEIVDLQDGTKARMLFELLHCYQDKYKSLSGHDVSLWEELTEKNGEEKMIQAFGDEYLDYKQENDDENEACEKRINRPIVFVIAVHNRFNRRLLRLLLRAALYDANIVIVVRRPL